MNEWNVTSAKPLNQLLRMAVMAGVESAVLIHIDRGDDLNARDAGGMTPLMLAAARNKPAICKLLLSAGADHRLLDLAFDGERNANLFGVSGADGLGIQIKDSEGNVAQPGIPLPQGRLVTEGQTLNYTLHLISNHHEFKAGDYRAAIRFKVDYY